MDTIETLGLPPVGTVGDGLGNVFVDVAGTWLTPDQAAEFAQKVFSAAARAHHQSAPTAGAA